MQPPPECPVGRSTAVPSARFSASSMLPLGPERLCACAASRPAGVSPGRRLPKWRLRGQGFGGGLAAAVGTDSDGGCQRARGWFVGPKQGRERSRFSPAGGVKSLLRSKEWRLGLGKEAAAAPKGAKELHLLIIPAAPPGKMPSGESFGTAELGKVLNNASQNPSPPGGCFVRWRACRCAA